VSVGGLLFESSVGSWLFEEVRDVDCVFEDDDEGRTLVLTFGMPNESRYTGCLDCGLLLFFTLVD
jgi:hypothetical protein